MKTRVLHPKRSIYVVSAFYSLLCRHTYHAFSIQSTTTSRSLSYGGGIREHRPLLEPSRRPLYMANWWQSFFGGGAYNLAIDYDSLAFPAPELAAWAKNGTIPQSSPSMPHLELATFAGGCFWGLELAFQRVVGVEYTVVGYTQGREKSPNYDQVVAGNTGHAEAVCIYFDPNQISYPQLLDIFFQRIDPTTINGQGRDYGKQYRTGIYYHSESQQEAAQQALLQAQSRHAKPIATECRAATAFWPAEEYHQQYLAKGGRLGVPQSAEKNCQEEIRCHG